MKIILLFFIVILLFLSCDEKNDFSVLVTIDLLNADHYIIEVTNDGNVVAYLTQCTETSFVKRVEVKVDGEWQNSGYAWACGSYPASNLELLPGKKMTNSIIFQDDNDYRIGVAVGKKRSEGFSWIYSNEF